MKLVKCKKCGAEMSKKATYCFQCGYPLRQQKCCPECGDVLGEGQKFCSNCGYKVVNGKRKWGILLGAMVLLIFAVIVFIIRLNGKKEYEYEINAYIQLKAEIKGDFRITEMYYSDKVAEGLTIDYIYRVYIVYQKPSGFEEEVLYIVDDNGWTYFVTDADSNNEGLYSYKFLAEMEIFGQEGLWRPSGEWESRSKSEINKIISKVD